MIRYELPDKCHVRIAVFDLLGRRVTMLEDGMLEAGVHEVLWRGITDDGEFVASGVYLFRLTAGSQSASGKMTLVR